MRPGLSTYVFLQQRLHPGLLDAMARALSPYGTPPYGAPVIEIFAARHHFDYTDRAVVRDIALWFRDSGIQPTLHQPLFSDSHWSRHTAPTLNLIDPEKSRRIDAMDEVKRALESAEQIPFTAITLHLGLKDDAWNLRALENSLTAIEHVKAFAHPLGVKVLLENLQNDVTTPAHLLEILRVGHFDTVGVTLDLGHAHLSGGTPAIDAAIELLKPRIRAVNVHDNQGPEIRKDDHLWPNTSNGPAGVLSPELEGLKDGIDWQNIGRHLTALPAGTPAILEITHELNETADSVQQKASAFFSHQARYAEQLAGS